MASAVHYVHPDKPRQLWINEVGVIESHRNQGIGKMLVRALLHLACELNCSEAWVLTDRENQIAQRLYSTCGGEPREQVMFTFKLERESR
jgi:aminoglycoside 6'-N-acetyltransferase I